MNAKRFKGPVFIIGNVRSGTKLLRDLLNRNTRIGIPVVESNFIPLLTREFGNPPKFKIDAEYDRFFRAFSRTSFYWIFQDQYGISLLRDHFIQKADRKSWCSIFEVIFRHYAPENREAAFIWGDKTPAYLNHMGLLKDLFPSARFVHIIRDPRDVCLSAKKTWGVSLYRTADKWQKDVDVARRSGQYLGGDYKEVLYEDLLDAPRDVLSSICAFLDCEFSDQMMRLEKPSESHGDTRGKTYIVHNNTQKYRRELSNSQVKRVEQIVHPVAQNIGYKFENDVRHVPLNPIMLILYRTYNVWAHARFFLKEYGMTKGLRLLSKLVFESRLPWWRIVANADSKIRRAQMLWKR